MLKNITRLEVNINDKSYQFHCDMDSPLGDVKEALFQYQKYIGQVEDHVKKQLDEKKAKEEADKLASEEITEAVIQG